MIEDFTSLLEHPNRTIAYDPTFTATLNSIAKDLETAGKEIVALWNSLERDWPPQYSDLQNRVWRKQLTLTPGELKDVKDAIAETRKATSDKELTTDDALRNCYAQYRYALSRFNGLKLYNTKMLRELTTIATVAKTKK